MTLTRGRLSLTVVCLLFGLLIMVQLRTESRLQQASGVDSSTDLAAIAGDLYDSNSVLRQEVDKLSTERSAEERSMATGDRADVVAELDRLSAFNGSLPVTGPGVELTVDAALRPVDMLDLLNEARNAGAEAIAVGGQRVVYNTDIDGTPGRLYVNGVLIGTPVVVKAIGQPDVLDRALARKGGMISYLKTSYPRASIDLVTRAVLSLPAYDQGFHVQAGG